MDKQETMKLLAILQTSYPNHYKTFDKDMMKLTLEMWWRAFADYDFEVVFRATQKYILQQKFPPTISELREEVIRIMNPDALKTGEQAWEEVISAVKKYGFYQQDKAFATMDERTKRATKAIGWQNICSSENIGIERANFYKMYDAISKDVKEQAMLPANLLTELKRLADKTKGIGGDQIEENTTALPVQEL